MPNALILGASGTLGGAIARDLLARGYDCGLQYHTHKAACDALTAEGRKTLCYAADFNTPEAPGALATQFLKDFGSADAVVWAAGMARDASLLNQSETDLRAVLNVNLKGCLLLCKALSRQFIRQKTGSVVLLSSHAARAGRTGGCAYAMAAAGLLALAKSAAREWGALGVRVNAVIPPFVAASKMGSGASPEFTEAYRLRRVLKVDSDGVNATVQAVAAALLNPAMSGQVLSADSRIA